MIPSSNENSVHLLDSFTNINGGAVECPMSKDDTCFDANYTCSSCCATEKAVNGALCWDGVFTKARCCENTEATQQVNTPPAAPPTYTPPAGTPICAKDPSCFDPNYECEGCCSTGLAKNGAPCWDAVYTTKRCCASSGANTPPMASASMPTLAQSTYTAPVDTMLPGLTQSGATQESDCTDDPMYAIYCQEGAKYSGWCDNPANQIAKHCKFSCKACY